MSTDPQARFRAPRADVPGSGYRVNRTPLSTYRLQFNRNFRFQDAQALAGYLDDLGITHLYASPIFQARRGSMHGYDISDPTCLNPELGTEEDFLALVQELRERGMGLILDVVPNHMAASDENTWWTDVLENGALSRWSHFFDVDWHPDNQALERRVLLPLLGSPYGRALENREFTLGLGENGLFVRYGDNRLPLCAASYVQVLGWRPEGAGEKDGPVPGSGGPAAALGEIVAAIERSLEPAAGPPDSSFKRRLWDLYRSLPEVRNLLDRALTAFNGRRGDPRSFDLLDRLLGSQVYRLSYWRLANEEINYRRFFAISELVSLRMEDPAVFTATHALALRLAQEGLVDGLRVDHVDGLVDPEAYLVALRRALPSAAAGDFYLVVEKILCGDEALPAAWPVMGTTGYDFLNTLNGLFVERHQARALTDLYTRFAGLGVGYGEVAYRKKKLIMETQFAGEMSALGRFLGHLVTDDRYGHDLPRRELAQGLVEVTACFPVYRTYTEGFKVMPRDRSAIEGAVEEARRRNPRLVSHVFHFLRRVLVLERPAYLSEQQWEARLAFVRRWQQYTGPIMAKGVEDTAFYVYNRLLSVNEVGGDPETLGLALDDFHRRMRTRRQLWPLTMNATSTHDTKRGEDVRARLNVLSEEPSAWAKRLERWRAWNRPHKTHVDGLPVPDGNDEMFLYQTLAGAWPLMESARPTFLKRLCAYLVKAVREAQVHSDWIEPNTAYEKAFTDFAEEILKPSGKNRFLKDLLDFQKWISFYGAINGLAQVLLKIAAPGVPDFYQGTELWDFSLVDPDNRRPVDFAKRRRLLSAQLSAKQGANLEDLLKNWNDGRVKLYVTWKALQFRRTRAGLFRQGEYVELQSAGREAGSLCAFARCTESAWAIAAVPRFSARRVRPGAFPLGRRAWGKSALLLPRDAPDHWVNIFTGEELRASSENRRRVLTLRSVFQRFPVALLSAT